MKSTFFLFILMNSFFLSCSFSHYDLVSPENNQKTNNLPTFYIHPSPVSKDFYSPVTIIYKGETYKAKGKIHGGQSSFYPKKSYTFKFPKDHLFSDPENPLFQKRRKIILTSNYDDHSYMRNSLAYFFWNKLDNKFKVNSFSSEVYKNGSYEGLYTVVDFIDKDYLIRNGQNPNANLYKGITNDVNFYLKDNLLIGFEKKEGNPVAGEEGAFLDLRNFIDLVNNLSLTENGFASKFEKIADTQSYYDWWFFISFLKAYDSIGKNSYHYHDLSFGGKWHCIPWDFNFSFGKISHFQKIAPGFDPSAVSQNAIFKKLVPNPVFSEIYKERYSKLLRSKLSLSVILNKVDKLYYELRKSAAKDGDKWSKPSLDREIIYLKNWLTKQHDIFSKFYNENS